MAAQGPVAHLFSADDGQEDSDFFEQLANDLGDDNTILYAEKDAGFDEAFSKLNIHGEGSDPSAPVSGIEDNSNAADDFWIEENLLSLDTEDGFKGGSIVADVRNTEAADVSNTEGSACPPQESYTQQIENAEKDIALTDIMPISSAELNFPPQTVNHVANGDQCLLMGADVKVQNKNITSQSEPLGLEADDESQHFASNSGAFLPLPGVSVSNPQSLLCPDPRVGTGTVDVGIIASPQAMLNGAAEKSAIPNSEQNQCMPETTSISPQSSVKELQWSNFGDAFQSSSRGESYSDFFSELADQKDSSSKCEADSNAWENKSTKITTFYSQEDLVVQSDGQIEEMGACNTREYSNQRYMGNSIDAQSAYTHIAAASVMTDQVDATKGEQKMMYDNDWSFSNAVVSGGPDVSGSAANYETQQHYQSWEDMYPGWYFDHITNEWKMKDSVPMDQYLAYNTEQIDTSHAQDGVMNNAMSQPESSLHMIEKQNSWSVAGQGSGMDMQALSNDQYASYNGLTDQQNVNNWENQYPGWYYDAVAQEWRQTAGDTTFREDFNVEGLQARDTSLSSPFPSSTWTEQQSQSYYQGNVNQSGYWPDLSQSSYSSGTDAIPMSRGMSFNTWTEPIAEMGGTNLLAMQNAENAPQNFQNVNTDVWDGFKANSIYSYETQTNYNVGNQATVSTDQSGFFQPYVPQTSHMPDGRPSHPLAVFGFGGKLVVMKAPQVVKPEPIVFHDLGQLVLSAENHTYNDGIAYFSALKSQGSTYPLGGHGSSSKELLKWIDERKEKCEHEDRHNTSVESLRVLWGVLKIACLHYGKLRPLIGAAGLKSQDEHRPEFAGGKMLAAANGQGQLVLAANQCPKTLHSLPTEDQLQATAHEVRMNLMDGKLKEALHLAQEGQLWGLALVLASQLGEKVYSDTIIQMAQQQFLPGSPLRSLLLLLAGQSTELFSSGSIALSAGTSSPYLLGSSISKDNAGGMLGDWLGNLSIIAANPTKGDEQVIIHLGDSLWKDQGEVAGAHVCYLVADRNFEYFSKEARLCLIGADHFKHPRTFVTPLTIQRTELFEYAKVQGNPQYVQVPFQPYKLLYAHMLAEAGKVTEANRYCQVVIKALKNAGHSPQIDFCRHSAMALEERLRLHSQGGYSLTFSTGKLVGKFMGTIDSTIHKIIGGPPVTATSQLHPNTETIGDWNLIDQKYPNMGTPVNSKASNSGDQKYPNMGTPVNSKNEQKYGYMVTPTKAVPLVPSPSINSLVNDNNNNNNSQTDMGIRSVSAPNLSRSPMQEVQTSMTKQELSSVSAKKPKPEASTGGYLGRFGIQILAKVVGFMKHNNKEAKLGDENKFYYDEKLKRWVEAGVEQSQDEIPLAPPPMAANFSSSQGTTPLDAKSNEESGGPTASTSDLPPMPPMNQFSARARMQGVRSRYVDTFNKGNTPSPVKSTGSPIAPVGTWGKATSAPSQFFASLDNSNEKRANGFTHDGNSLLPNMSLSLHGVQADREPLLPKDLSSSFMAMPLAERHSSVNDLSMLSVNKSATEEKNNMITPSPTLNIARAASWNGDTSGMQNFISGASSTGVNQRISDIGEMSSTSGLPSSSPTPPAFHGGFRSGISLSSGPHAGIFGEMQEVEL